MTKKILCPTCKHFHATATEHSLNENEYFKTYDVCPYKDYFHTVCDDYAPIEEETPLSHVIRAVEEVSEAHSIRAVEVGDKYLISFLIPNPRAKSACTCGSSCKCKGGEE